MSKRKILFELIGINLVAVLILTSCQSATTVVAPTATLLAPAAPANQTMPIATATSAPVATNTPAATATNTPAATATTAPAATNTIPPTAQPGAQVIPTMNAYCRKGPGTGYFEITFLQKGTAYNVIGRNGLNTWWLVQTSGNSNCWMGDPNASKQGPVDQAPVVLVPPLPLTPSTFVYTRTCDPTLHTMKVSLEWTTVDNVTGYQIYRNGERLVAVGVGVTSYEDNAPGGADLVYELEAFNDYGASASISTDVAACD